MSAARQFREIFLGCLDASYSEAERDRLLAAGLHDLLLYEVADELLAPTRSADLESRLRQLDSRFAATDAEALHRAASDTDPDPMDPGQIQAVLARRPLTLVVFPGIFSEMIDTRPFEELFERATAGHASWAAAIEDFRATRPQAEVEATLFDPQFDLASLRSAAPAEARRPRALGELIEVASFDDDAGEGALVTVVLLRPGRLSLETMNELQAMAEIARRRLAKYFRVAGLPDRVALLGYSMGLDVALDALELARADGAEWASRVEAVVSLGGVIYGSHLADQALRPEGDQVGALPHRQVSLLREVTASLRETHGLGFFRKIGVVASNTRAWLRFALGWSHLVDDLARQFASTEVARVLRTGERADTLGLVGLITPAVRAFRLLAPNQYSNNVLRFKTLVEAALAGIDTLTTHRRLEWWHLHQLALSELRLYSLGGTMTTSRLATSEGPLGANRLAYAADSLEYLFLCQGHDDFTQATAISLNDSQVALPRTVFWPGIGLAEQAPEAHPDLTFLGLLGTHHWGMIFRSVVPQDDASTHSPFPRLTLLKAIATKIALDST